MPELPEIELLRCELSSEIVGRQVAKARLLKGSSHIDPALLEGGTVTQVRRRGKMLVIEFDTAQALVIHLMMVGQLLLSPPFDGEPNDARMILDFGGGSRLTLGQVDLKYVHLMPTDRVEAWPSIQKLGLDPLDEDFGVEVLERLLSQRRGAIKSFLLNQAHVAGIGNTYADEILFHARLHPQRRAGGLSGEEVRRLHASIVETLRRGIALDGSSEMAFVHLDGRKGEFQEHFEVNRRKGQPCLVCDTSVEKIKVGGRGTYFCPQCQRQQNRA